MSRWRQLLKPLLLAAVVYYTIRWQSAEETQELNVQDLGEETYVDGRFTRRIVAVGDLHGDMGNALKVLQMADVVDQHGNWSGKVDIFVQTGDIIDRLVHLRAYGCQ